MKKRMLVLMITVMLTGSHVYAGNGDLIVNGKIGIGTTTTPTSPLTLSDYVVTSSFPTLVGSKLQINDTSTQTASGYQTPVYIATVPKVSANSSANNVGLMVNAEHPASTVQTGMLYGAIIRAGTKATSEAGFVTGLQALARNSGTGAASMLAGISSDSSNLTTGSATTNCGILSQTHNYGTIGTDYAFEGAVFNNTSGSITTAYGSYYLVQNLGGGTIGTAYGVYGKVLNSNGSIPTGYGIYIDSVQATNKWSLYVSDPAAPSYFAGNVGIGTASPGYKLDVRGLVASNGQVLTSDSRFKKNLLPIEGSLSKIRKLEGISFEWKTEEYKDRGFPDGRQYGVIAQQVEKVLPEIVKVGPDGSKSVAYTEIIPVLIEAIKEQQKTIEKQQEEIRLIKSLLK
jgi:hypothetical protein